ncbi:ribonuclease HII [Clostridium moniliforme]|uniref:Ribonuclease HII n=1 Tax=Clostridium moniliforme TaxID=39489 RepID=A0ABS4EX12_9CLOT|nr:ribonuclease HII [Clostridium moniliforme]MBP1888528.1 ribonuclease HII [Clostridium moniliforme]
MELLNMNLENMSYKSIKEEFDKIEFDFNDEKMMMLSNILLSDKRKNVQSLGNKILKEKKKIENELERVKKMYDFDRGFSKGKLLAGVDEVGRGPLAGPIVSAAVILDLNVIDDEMIFYLNDSKKLSEKKREELSKIIKEKAIAYYISEASNDEIDEKGIGVCNNEVFLKAVYGLITNPSIVLSDGYKVKGINIENKSVIKGDTKSASIAAASIIAKVYRDNLMKKLSEKYPEYGFEHNVGYGAKTHVDAIKKYGATPIHRMSFLRNILEK